MPNNITKLTSAERDLLKSKSTFSLPDNPSNKGFSAEQIKKKQYEPSLILFDWLTQLINEVDSEVSGVKGDISDIADGTTVLPFATKAAQDEDGNNIKETYAVSIDSEPGSKSSTFQKKYYKLVNKNGEKIGSSLVVDIALADTSYAGLLSAADKALIDTIPNKVNKITNANKVYCTDDTGVLDEIGYDDYVDGDFVRRDSNNQVYVPATPTANTHAASKKYADTFGKSIELTINSSTYVMTAKLKDAGGNVLSTQTIDLPLETMVVGGSYDSTNKKVILTLQNAQTVEFSVADLVDGLLAYSDFNITGGAITSISVNGVNYGIAENVSVTTLPKVVQSTTDLPATNDGYMYLVLDNGYLYIYDVEDGWTQAYQYTSDLFTITEVDNIVED